ncbi:hypothetical protein Glove_740g7 [Diversispora epigaea]|uniref:Uncharacterized protein n=1 Tax=Diversispora epigaea TaxID=1348612 RepID=A0A397G375_9GLOM|nr:hypothetical protein Glove_740g7 [Diversispora epigaea]
MRILPKSARETKEQFFGKRGWSLHTILVFTKCNIDQLNVQTFDHWSTDTKQDAWFTVSSFDSVFETLDPRPQWIEILSDNGAHYHNSELITTIANWYQWYNIKIRGWYFFEPGEVKTSVDSHHAQIAHAIKRYVRIGHNLDEGEKIQVAISDLGRTSVVNIEPTHDNYNDVRFMHISVINRIPIFVHSTSAKITPHSIPKNPRNFPLSHVQAVEETFELKRGWALKSNQKYGKREAGKWMTKTVKSYYIYGL